jgi:hypothetical protein
LIRNRKLLVVQVLTILMMVSSAMTMSCIGDKTIKYKPFTVNEGLVHFTFEYPDFLRVPIVSSSLEPQSTLDPQSISVGTLGIIQPWWRVNGDVSNGFVYLDITISTISDSFPNAKAMMDYSLSRSEELEEFKLLKHSPVTIAGTNGEIIVYSYFGLRSLGKSAETGTSYEAYFDLKGQIWKIWMIADEYTVAERAEADFDHVLQTLQILD